jgi:hypothetical protein
VEFGHDKILGPLIINLKFSGIEDDKSDDYDNDGDNKDNNVPSSVPMD